MIVKVEYYYWNFVIVIVNYRRPTLNMRTDDLPRDCNVFHFIFRFECMIACTLMGSFMHIFQPLNHFYSYSLFLTGFFFFFQRIRLLTTHLQIKSISTPSHLHWKLILNYDCDLIFTVRLTMSAHLTIALTIAFAMIVNARIVVARSASMLPSEMLKNMESERLPNKMVFKKNSLI